MVPPSTSVKLRPSVTRASRVNPEDHRWPNDRWRGVLASRFHWDTQRGLVAGGYEYQRNCAGTVSLTSDGGRRFQVRRRSRWAPRRWPSRRGCAAWPCAASRRYWRHEDVFVRDRKKGVTTWIRENNRSGSLYSGLPSISANGRFVAFESPAPDLVKGDRNDHVDVFLHDRKRGRTPLLSVSSERTQGKRRKLVPGDLRQWSLRRLLVFGLEPGGGRPP
jgi:hypothetical protein